ncbi:hypothetical protein [Halotia branconii]|uniref:Uncharacterized protein n=1 Tax=Halotia branconii CENA392 TaxID=1539056 RepID=A0AAJ6P8R6_9CYAN|nr:hypothetical protein [Halotia branconii]WGV24975.1 hypothetical protein QI031_24930 [Halotia branconii CENA392]
MEPVTLTAVATAIATLIFSEALKEGGKTLGQGISQQVTQLLTAIRQKFQTAGTEGILKRAEENPTEKNQAKFQDELETQMEEDEAFAKQLQALMAQLQANDTVKQIVVKGVTVKGKATVGDINLEAAREGAVNQEAVVDSEFGDDLNLGDVNLKA